MRILLITALIISHFTGFSQYDKTPVLTVNSKVMLNVSSQGAVYHNHIVKKGHTIYSIARAFQVDAETIYTYNRLSSQTPIEIGQKVKIPIDISYIQTEERQVLNQANKYVPMYYKTQPKDNLYRISKVYFNQSITSMKMRNNLASTNLPLNHLILVGWLPLSTDAINTSETIATTVRAEKTRSYPSKTTQEITTTTTQIHEPTATHTAPIISTTTTISIDPMTSNEPTSSTTPNITSEPAVINLDSLAKANRFNVSLLGQLTYDPKMTIKKHKDVAYWDKNLNDNGSVFALHDSAMLGSYIYLYNPLVKRSIKVKVIGRIPYGTYENDVKLVISPHAAKQLGSVDRRFKVEVEYILGK